MKNLLIGAIALVIIGLIAFFFLSDRVMAPTPDSAPTVEDRMPVEPDGGIGDGAGPIEEDNNDNEEREPEEVIGQSVQGTEIVAHHFGTGDREVLFVGGVHGSFAPNTVAVAEQLITELEAGNISVPAGLMVTVIPDLNPDATGGSNTLAGRLNANGVDLNRNFDCEWNAEGVWRNTPVSGGDESFSEPEARAVRDYVQSNNVIGAVVYYAADGGVYASSCGEPDLDLFPLTSKLTNTYASASGYTANEEFDAYKISGDMTNWMAKEGVPAIGVLLSDYTGSEWSKNQAGIEATLNHFAK